MLKRLDLRAKAAANIIAPAIPHPISVGTAGQLGIALPTALAPACSASRTDKRRGKTPAGSPSSAKKPRARIPSPIQVTGDGSSMAQSEETFPNLTVGNSSPYDQPKTTPPVGLVSFPFPPEGISLLESFYQKEVESVSTQSHSSLTSDLGENVLKVILSL